MIGSLFAGISGLNANATAMTVIGDNIANVNTTAFKANRSSFANVLSQSLGSSTANGIGRGVEFWGTSPLWTQGSLENTGSPTDLAINGKGFFMVQDDTGTNYFTRAGQFHLDEAGDMVNPDGYLVQGYQIDAAGNLGNLATISIPGERISPPSVTTEFSLDINLDASTPTTGTYSASQSVFDTLGNAIPLTLTFTKTANLREWTVGAAIPTTAGSGVSFNPGAGASATITMTFDANGNLFTPAADQTLRLALTNGAANPLDINWDLVDATGTNLGDINGFSSPSSTTFQYQDGYSSGVLRGISVDEDGVVTAAYSNGQLTPTFQIALVDFPSYDGLAKMGQNLYSESLDSGQPMPGVAGNGRLGSITASAIEMSNIDLAQEFVKMITTQRAFQANSRVITTSDEILSELINIKR
ncbi:Flagellar hook protein FlgE [Olavius sp. associated proteobacterium Delta 1]|nr:Flagellar hook protein FlgE [Olavius sp. associated proteobacterium Delta 1]